MIGFCLLTAALFTAAPEVFHAQGEMAGEVTSTSVILQSRLTSVAKLTDGDVPGTSGVARFELSESDDFGSSRTTDWLKAAPENDFIVKVQVKGLKPATQYYYRLIFGSDRDSVQTGETCSFRTLQGRDGTDEVSFVVVTGMNYMSFHYGKVKEGKRTGVGAYEGDDKQEGFPALATIAKMKPDFFVGTGDNVYYDSHDDREATELRDLRRKWHEQFVQPRFVKLFRHVPTYWEKDDHDHRFNDCDREGNRKPLSDLGIQTFRQQVPVVDPLDPEAKTYRTYRVNQHLQIWLVEGRDYRSPNRMPDGPDKTLWGADQIAWLKQTLRESDATWKLLISPTPMVGPDDAYKRDNHTNHKGFRHEGRAFFDWIKQQRLDRKGFHVICGDRHWQYHSIDPTGIEEFSSGALVDSNSRLGRDPGDPKSTDPDAKIKQLHTQTEASGGFLKVTVQDNGDIRFEFFDENGERLYRVVKPVWRHKAEGGQPDKVEASR
ncbi:alkaline phosphatase D family protein [Fuerstiella marisgermanici]|uniref:PhoD-like phosphatase n=1 Tax=Fuerstiella marisgermanici TaxID=1891926 RepID=A0A1P8WPI6_9PLAN|nr:alkaline phosphatase D family protein [Fuerstiella marisgermanici]APZ95966.1 PhoD-like phosphatase [Fuerstiella marisgermanici]